MCLNEAAKFFYIVENLPQNDAHWEDASPEWRLNSSLPIFLKYFEIAITIASANGNIKMLNWLYNKEAIDIASENGHVNVLQCLEDRDNVIE